MTCGSRRKALYLSSALAAIVSVGITGEANAADQTYQFDIPAESLGQALTDFSRASSQQIVFSEEVTAGKSTRGIHGRYTVPEALSALLSGTNLVADTNTAGVMAVRSKNVQAAQNDWAAQNSPSAVVETVTVTGSRLVTATKENYQDVKTFSREQIDQSGQPTVSDFLNTLTDVSLQSSDFGAVAGQGFDNSVRLHGLPLGSTLTLMDGHRLEGSGTGGGAYFNLNNIPLAVVDHVDVLPIGSSAVYGSDAIAGVVNVVLKKDFTGVSSSASVGFADGIAQESADLAWGERLGRLYVSVIASYQGNSELQGSERAITADSNFTKFGGPNKDVVYCAPGNVFSRNGQILPGGPAGNTATFAGVSSSSASGAPSFNYGSLNFCGANSGIDFIPRQMQAGGMARAQYELSPTTSLFAQFIYGHFEYDRTAGLPAIPATTTSQTITVPASNPFNPFGTTVGVGGLVIGAPQQYERQNNNFLDGMIGAEGELFQDWHWELTGQWSFEKASTHELLLNRTALQAALSSTNSATALNPFVNAPGASSQVLSGLENDIFLGESGRNLLINGFVRGEPFKLPAGPVQLVFGGEYSNDGIGNANYVQAGTTLINASSEGRGNYSAFGEARVPLLSSNSDQPGQELLTATVSGRYDHYSDFGGAFTPDFGVELRPIAGLLVRGSYSEAFQAPTLSELYYPKTSSVGNVADPKNGGALEPVTLVSGGNPNLMPQTAVTRSLGFVYDGDLVPGLRVSVTNWDISAVNEIQSLTSALIVANEGVLPGAVIRSTGCGVAVCPITQVNATYENFGALRVEGLDYQIDYNLSTDIGQFHPYTLATETYHYTAALTPGSAPVDGLGKAQASNDWSPTWKLTAGLGWKLDAYSLNADGRYVSSYQDYGTTRMIGNFWIFDANAKIDLNSLIDLSSTPLMSSFIAIGGVNLFNTLPQYSNFSSSSIGYDPAQGDIRGRYLYLRIGTKL